MGTTQDVTVGATGRTAAVGEMPAAARGIGDARPLVAYLSASGTMGGAERVLLDLVEATAALPEAPRQLVVCAAEGALVDALRGGGHEVLLLPWPSAVARLGDFGAMGITGLLRVAGRGVLALPAALGYLRRLRAVLAARQPALVQSNGFKMHVLAAVARPAGARVIWHLHDFTSGRAVMTRALALLRSRCDAAVANSRAVADDALRTLGSRLPVTPVLNAIDLDRFAVHGPVEDLDARAGLPPSPAGIVRIGIVATLARWKGHEVFLRAVARLPHELPWRAYVVSGALYQTDDSQWSLDALRALARELGVADRTGFTGFLPDAAAAMRALDVVVHASTRPEPFGLVIAEAMAVGRTVLVSAAGGATELGEDGHSVIHFAPGDDAALATRLETLVRDAETRRRLGAAAAEMARERFTRDRMARQVHAVHRAVLGEGKGRWPVTPSE